MKKFGFATVIASGLIAGALGATTPAAQAAFAVPAGVDHHVWLDQIGPHVNVPHVDNTVHQSH
jgi:hypothetical protein